MSVVRREDLRSPALTPLERQAVELVRRAGVAGMEPVALRSALGIRERSMWVLAARLLDREQLRLVGGRLIVRQRS